MDAPHIWLICGRALKTYVGLHDQLSHGSSVLYPLSICCKTRCGNRVVACKDNRLITARQCVPTCYHVITWKIPGQICHFIFGIEVIKDDSIIKAECTLRNKTENIHLIDTWVVSLKFFIILRSSSSITSLFITSTLNVEIFWNFQKSQIIIRYFSTSPFLSK